MTPERAITDKMSDLRLSLAAAEEEAEVQRERAWSAERELEVVRAVVHGHVQVIRGMCTDTLDHREIDRALVRLDDLVQTVTNNSGEMTP